MSRRGGDGMGWGTSTVATEAAVQAGQRRLFEEIGAFLDDHRLAISPSNYALVYWVLTKSNADAVAAVALATGDGLRLTQDQADQIIAAIGRGGTGQDNVPPASAPNGPTAAEIEEIQAQIDNFAHLVDRTRSNTESYGRDLEAQADELSGAAPDAALAELIRLTSTMIDRTRSAEQALDAATGEARALRAKLDRARAEANHDALTGLPNRRAFEAHYDERKAAAGPMAIAICDIDHFKSINDGHGHSVGDRVLKAVADVMRTECKGHHVARLGGEEFVMLFSGISTSEARDLVEQTRQTLAGRNLRVRETDKPIGIVTFSAGITTCAEGESRETALGRADAMLYLAKANGRNRVEVG